MRGVVLSVMACVSLAACSGGGSGPDNSAANAAGQGAPVIPDTTDNASGPSGIAAGPLDAYVGKYPFDQVDGVSFYDQPAVKAAVGKAIADKQIAAMVVDPAAGPADMVFRKDGRIGAWACEQHNCGDHQWTVLVDPARGDAQICYHDASTMQGQSRWYDGQGGASLRPGAACPAGDTPDT